MVVDRCLSPKTLICYASQLYLLCDNGAVNLILSLFSPVYSFQNFNFGSNRGSSLRHFLCKTLLPQVLVTTMLFTEVEDLKATWRIFSPSLKNEKKVHSKRISYTFSKKVFFISWVIELSSPKI